jgi:hypothetical protein
MSEALFSERSAKPDDSAMSTALGRTKRHWDDLAGYVAEAAPEAKPEWRHYGKKNGWVFVVRGKRSALMYMIPHEKYFTASFAYKGEAAQAATESDLPAAVIEMIRKAPKYPEGRAVRMDVKSAADLTIVKRLLVIKRDTSAV